MVGDQKHWPRRGQALGALHLDRPVVHTKGDAKDALDQRSEPARQCHRDAASVGMLTAGTAVLCRFG